jgi:hypothetical protein
MDDFALQRRLDNIASAAHAAGAPSEELLLRLEVIAKSSARLVEIAEAILKLAIAAEDRMRNKLSGFERCPPGGP